MLRPGRKPDKARVTRAALALMAGMLCAIMGLRRAASLRSTAARLRRWACVLEHLALILSEGTLTLPEAFEQAATAPLPPDALLRALATGLRAQPLLSLSALYAAHDTPTPERDVLARLMARLGHGSLEARCQAVSQAAQELALMASDARQTADKDATMWRNLGFIGGACLTLMLL